MDSMRHFLYVYIILHINEWVSSQCPKYLQVESQYSNNWLFVNVTCQHDEVGSADPSPRDSTEEKAFPDGIKKFGRMKSDPYLYYSQTQDEAKNQQKSSRLLKPFDTTMKASSFIASDFPFRSVRSRDIMPLQIYGECINSFQRTKLSINCSYLKFDSRSVNNSVEHLKIFSKGKIELSPDWIGNSTNLLTLNINSMNGMVLPSDCSWLPNSIYSLDLSYTPLKELILNGRCLQLKTLLLQMTSIRRLSLCLESLEELDASWNSLSADGLELNCEEATQNVKKLKLNNNKISFWSTCGWPSLANLELQHNELSDVSLTNCSSPYLTHVDLSYNRLQEVSKLYPQQLSVINLSHNQLRRTSPFPRLVKEINLGHNSLSEVVKGTFVEASELLSLDLSHNKLTVIYAHHFLGLRSLRVLDLSNNKISYVTAGAFIHLRYLRTLRIEYNNLQQLDSRLLASLTPGEVEFQANNNPWQCSCHLLTTLTILSRASCRTHCKDKPNLTCREGGVYVKAENVLHECLKAVNELENTGVINLPERQASDEDLSEEKREGGFSHYLLAIPVTLLLLGVPLLGLGIKKLYFRRRNIKTCSCCRSDSSPATGEFSPVSTKNSTHPQLESDSDSETGF